MDRRKRRFGLQKAAQTCRVNKQRRKVAVGRRATNLHALPAADGEAPTIAAATVALRHPQVAGYAG